MPAAPRLCTADLAQLTGQPVTEGMAVSFRRKTMQGQYGNVVVPDTVTVQADEDGAIAIELFPGSMEIQVKGTTNTWRAEFDLGETGSTNIGELISQAAGPITDARVAAAEAARDKAEEWAENPEDDEVEAGQFSAKHHAIKAAASAAAAANDAGATAADRAVVEPLAAQVALDADATAADRTQTGLDRVATGEDRAATGEDRTATAADRVQTEMDAAAADADRISAQAAQAAAEVAAGLAQTAALSMIGPETLYPVDDFPIPDGWWDTNVRYGTTGDYDERAVISNWHPALVADGRDLFWFSALEADADGALLDGSNGGGVVAAVGVAIGTWLAAYETMELGAELRSTGTIAISGTATPATYDTSTGAGSASRAASVSNQSSVQFAGVIPGRLYAIDITSDPTTQMIVRDAAGNGTILQILTTNVRGLYVVTAPASGSFFIHPNVNSTTIAFTVHSVREITNANDFAYLTQATGNLRFLLGRQPVSGVRNRVRNSSTLVGNSFNSGATIAANTQPDLDGELTLSTYTQPDGAGNMRAILEGGVVAGQSFRFSADMKRISGGSGLTLDIGDGTLTNLTVPDTLTRVEATVVAGANGAFLDLRCGSACEWAVGNVQVEPGVVATAYQRVGASSLDVTEEGVRSIPILRGDLNDDRMGVVLPSEKNRARYPSDLRPGHPDGWQKYSVTVTQDTFTAIDATPAQKRISNGATGTTFVSSTGRFISFKARQGLARYGQVVFDADAVPFANIDLQTGAVGTVPAGMTVVVGEPDVDGWRLVVVTLTSTTADRLSFAMVDSLSAVRVANYTGATGSLGFKDLMDKAGTSPADFEGDVVGTGIIAGRAGIWAETVRNPRLISREVQTALLTGKLLPGSDVLGLPAIVHGPSTDASRGLVDLLLYDRVLSDAEIKKMVRRLRGAGAGRRLVEGPELLGDPTELSDWIAGGTVRSYSANVVTLTNTGGGFGYFSLPTINAPADAVGVIFRYPARRAARFVLRETDNGNSGVLVGTSNMNTTGGIYVGGIGPNRTVSIGAHTDNNVNGAQFFIDTPLSLKFLLQE